MTIFDFIKKYGTVGMSMFLRESYNFGDINIPRKEIADEFKRMTDDLEKALNDVYKRYIK